MTQNNIETAVEVKNITKSYPGVTANDSVDFKVFKGEIHALVGENGAGKSTLVKILYGIEQPDSGEIFINPDNKILNRVEESMDRSDKLKEFYNQESIDDLNLTLRANIGSNDEIQAFNDQLNSYLLIKI